MSDDTDAHEVSTASDSIPDMAEVLEKFGIRDHFVEIPLQDYLEKIEFATIATSPENFSISQRIKSMVRAARNKHQTLTSTRELKY